MACIDGHDWKPERYGVYECKDCGMRKYLVERLRRGSDEQSND